MKYSGGLTPLNIWNNVLDYDPVCLSKIILFYDIDLYKNTQLSGGLVDNPSHSKKKPVFLSPIPACMYYGKLNTEQNFK